MIFYIYLSVNLYICLNMGNTNIKSEAKQYRKVEERENKWLGKI